MATDMRLRVLTVAAICVLAVAVACTAHTAQTGNADTLAGQGAGSWSDGLPAGITPPAPWGPDVQSSVADDIGVQTTGTGAPSSSDGIVLWTTGGVTDWAGPVPTCGWGADTSSFPTAATATPAPNVCVFGGMSPGCVYPSVLVSGGVTQTLAAAAPPTGNSPGGLFYGAADGYLSFSLEPDGYVYVCHGEVGMLVAPNNDAIVYAERVGLPRSSGVWGIVPVRVETVRVADAARPGGVLAHIDPLPGGDFKIFIAPVSLSDVTITALDRSGQTLAETNVDR